MSSIADEKCEIFVSETEVNEWMKNADWSCTDGERYSVDDDVVILDICDDNKGYSDPTKHVPRPRLFRRCWMIVADGIFGVSVFCWLH